MADNSILAAYLASKQLAGGSRDPRETARARFAASLMTQGSETTPVRSWGEGLARALQGGIGGLVSGYAEKERTDTESGNQKALAEYLSTGNVGALSGVKGELGNILGAQLAGQRFDIDRTKQGIDAFGVAHGASGAPAAAGAPPATPSAGAIQSNPLAPLPGGSLPGGSFANNSGNIRSTAPGNVNGFATYDTPQAGANAHFQNYQAYVKQNPNITVAQALAKWSPPNENNTNGIISQLSEQTGINPGMPLAEVQDPAMAAQLLDAQTRLEKGGLPQEFNADTFMAATGGTAGPGSVPPGSIAQPPMQMAQGSGGDGTGTPVPTPSAASGPPEVPRPQPTPAQIEKYQRLMAGPNGLTRQQAEQGLEKEVTDEWQMRRQQSLETWKDQQQSKRQNEKAAIDLGQKAPMEAIAKRVDNYETKIRPVAQAAANDIASIHQVRQILDAGAFTGTGANAKVMLGKLGELVGIPSEMAQNTQVLGSALAKRVLSASGGTLGTGFSNADRDFMETAAGGKINLDEGAIRRILDLGERQGRMTLKNHDAEADRVKRLPGMGQLGDDQFRVDAPPTYAEWSKANPLAPLQGAPSPAGAPAALSAPAAPQGGGGAAEGATATNPQTGQKIVFRGGQWVPLQ